MIRGADIRVGLAQISIKRMSAGCRSRQGVKPMPVISTNNAANTAVRYLNINSQQQSDSLAKLASGSRITKASDDAAGLAISTRLSSDVTTLSQAATNASHAVSVLQ